MRTLPVFAMSYKINAENIMKYEGKRTISKALFLLNESRLNKK